MSIYQIFTPGIACLILFLESTHLLAGSVASIGGRVTDPQGGLVAGAVITLYARDTTVRFKATSDENGVYRFDRLRPAEYVVEAEATGFAHSQARTVRLESEGSLTLDISLRLMGPREEVVVTASGTPQPVDEVSKAITLVSQAEIEERDEFAISEALRHVPGLRVQQLGGPGAFTSIRIRGLRDEDTAVLIDGLRFRDPSSTQADASGLLEDLLTTNIDHLEILRGSGSSLYGTNAIGGVINVLTVEGGSR